MLKALIKTQLLGMLTGRLQLRRAQKKRKPASKLLLVLAAIYIVGAVGLSMGVFFQQMLTAFAPLNLLWLYFAIAGLAGFFLSFIGSVFLAQSSLFSAKDDELLLAMPIPPGQILLARSISLYLIALAFQALMLVPALVVWLIFGSFHLGSLLLFLLCFALLPLPTLALSILLGWLLALISSRLKHKNLIVTLASIAFLIAYFIGYSKLMESMNQLVSQGQQLAQSVRSALPPAFHFGTAIAGRELLSLLWYALLCLLPFALVMALVARNYLRVLTTKRGAARIEYKGGGFKASSLMQALAHKEIRRFFTSPIYLMNAGIGLLFMIGLPIYLMLDRNTLGLITGQLNLPRAWLGAAAVALISLLSGSIFITAPSISLEGKSLWILQSLPIKPIQALLAKALAHIAITLPAILISSLILGIGLKLDAFMFAMCLLLPLMVTIFTALLGLALNLRFPKLEWRTETEAVKQSMSTFLAMMLGTLIVGGLVALFFLVKSIGITLYLLLCLLFFALVSALLFWHLRRTAEKAFLDLSEA